MVLSAEDFQKAFEGAPDPFPSTSDAVPKPAGSSSANAPLNTDSETLFPSLGNLHANPSTSKTATAHPVKAARAVKPVSTPVFTDSFVLAGIDASANHTRDGKPKTLGDIVKDVMVKHKVRVELFSQKMNNETTFTVTGASESSVEQAKRALTTSLSPTITLTVQTPASLVGVIVGAKGANLKRIRDQTSTRIDIPRREKETLTVPNANGHDSSSRSASPLLTSPMENSEITIPITITGASSMAHQARDMIQEIIGERTSQATQKIKVTPDHVYLFVLSRRSDFLKVAAGINADVNISRDDAAKEIIVTGDKEAVAKVINSIRSCMAFYEGDLTKVKITLPKHQHRLFNAQAMDSIFQKSKCSVVLPPSNEPSEDVHVWGKAANLGPGLQAVMERATSRHTDSIKIPGSAPHHALYHIQMSGYDITFGNAHPDIEVHFPPAVPGATSVDFIGDGAAVDKAHKQLATYLALLENATREIQIDYLIHGILNAKAAKQLKGYHGSKNTLVYFPPEAEANSTVLLVYDPTTEQAVKDKQAVLTEVEKEIMELVGTLGQIKTETVSVEKKWHDAVTGKNNSTLNALIGEDRALAIEVGGTGHEDIVVIRGSPSDVDRATKDILRIVEEAKNNAIDNSYVTEFSVPQQYVPRIVGSAGANIQKYREQLDVKIMIDDARDAGSDQAGGGKKKKSATSIQSIVRITGRKHNAEEAKKRILAQVDKLADETSETLKIPRQYHSAIVGAQGKYIQRLQEKYGVKINMARENDASPDEVQIRGGKKGVSLAKSEIQELVEYEKENSNTVVVHVSTRAIPRILGAKGAKIHEIMAETSAHIDVSDKDKRDESAGTAPVTIKGTKKAVAAAKSAIMAIASAVDEETTVTVHIETKFHRTIIGGGGVGLKNLLARVGAPSDPKEQAGLVRFPQGGDEVTIRGERALVKKIQAELERVATGLRERVVLGVVIPSQQHRMLIGHGGAPLMELEKKTGAEVQFPGSRSYNQVASAENAGEFEDADPKNIVKVVGPRAACEKAIAELLDAVSKAPSRERKEHDRDRAGGSGPTATVQIPFKHYHLLRPNGNLFRDLRSVGVHFSQEGKPQHDNGAAGRIDDEVDADSHGVEWRLVPYGAGAEDGITELTMKARDAESLELAQKFIREALEKADGIAHIGYMTFPDRGAFPRIIGNKGSVIDSLSVESGAEIIVPRDDVTIKIYGNEEAVNRAKASITRVAFGGGRRRRNED